MLFSSGPRVSPSWVSGKLLLFDRGRVGASWLSAGGDGDGGHLAGRVCVLDTMLHACWPASTFSWPWRNSGGTNCLLLHGGGIQLGSCWLWNWPSCKRKGKLPPQEPLTSFSTFPKFHGKAHVFHWVANDLLPTVLLGCERDMRVSSLIRWLREAYCLNILTWQSWVATLCLARKPRLAWGNPECPLLWDSLDHLILHV